MKWPLFLALMYPITLIFVGGSVVLSEPHPTQLSIAGIPMPDKSDIANIVINGTTGAGKTTITKELLSGIRRAGKESHCLRYQWRPY